MIVIVDIDGTLSDSRHREHHLQGEKPDWDAFFNGCHADPVVVPVLRSVHALWMAGNQLVLVTGRPERLRSVTTIWLDDNGVPHQKLLMRGDDDHRPSHVYKRDAVIRHVTTALHPAEAVLAIDNSEADCAMYRELGIPTMQFALA